MSDTYPPFTVASDPAGNYRLTVRHDRDSRFGSCSDYCVSLEMGADDWRQVIAAVLAKLPSDPGCVRVVPAGEMPFPEVADPLFDQSDDDVRDIAGAVMREPWDDVPGRGWVPAVEGGGDRRADTGAT